MSTYLSTQNIISRLFEPFRVFAAVFIAVIFWLYPAIVQPSQPNGEKIRIPLQEYGGIKLVTAIESRAPNCDKSCQIDVCIDWKPGPSPTCPKPGPGGGCCFAYETQCDPGCVDPIPTLPPSISASLNCSQNGNNGWCIGSLSLDLTASDPQGQTVIISGVLNGVAFACPIGVTSCSIPISSEGAGSITYRADSSTGLSATGSTNYQLDSTKPMLAGTLSGVTASNNWYRSDVSVDVISSDSVSGLAFVSAVVDGGSPMTPDLPIIFPDGIHTLLLTSYDNAGNISQVSKIIQVDTITPTVSVALGGISGTNGWYISTVVVTPSANDSSSGIALLEAMVDGSSWFPINSPLSFSDGVHNFRFRATDNVGNVTETALQTIKVDTVTPKISTSISGSNGTIGWYVSNVTVSPVAQDAESGVALLEIKIDNEEWVKAEEVHTFFEGVHNYQIRATDIAGNITESSIRTLKVDTITPVINVSIKGVSGINGWYVSKVEVTSTAYDGNSGVSSLDFVVDAGVWEKYTSPLGFTDGVHTVKFRVTDYAGNVTETLSKEIKVDTYTPFVSLKIDGTSGFNGWFVSPVTIEPIVNDSVSGVASVQVAVDDGGWAVVNNSIPFGEGVHTYQFKVVDGAGNSIIIPAQNLKVDTIAPIIEMTKRLSLGETVDYHLMDHGSGLYIYRAVIEDEDEKYKKVVWVDDISGNLFENQILWDGKFTDDKKAGWGKYYLTLKIRDVAGNEAMRTAVINVTPFSSLTEIPEFNPPPSIVNHSLDVETEIEVPSFGGEINNKIGIGEITTLDEGGEVHNDEVEEQNVIINDGGEINGQLYTASFTDIIFNEGGSLVNWVEDAIDEASFTLGEVTNSKSNSNPDNVLWGLAATTLAGTALADWKKKREDEENIKNENLGKLRSRRESEKNRNAEIRARKMTTQVSRSQIVKISNRERAEGFVIAAQQAEKKRLREQKLKERQQAGLMAYYQGRKIGEVLNSDLLEEKTTSFEKTMDWIDQHQAEISIGIGVAVGVAAIIASGGLAAPWVMAAWIGGAAAVAGGTVALGTVGLNSYYGRPLGDNVLRNLFIAGATAGAVAGVGFLFQSAVQGVGIYCSLNVSACSKVEPVLNAFDALEEAYLYLKGSYQTWIGDGNGAAETYSELQAEYVDGGVPGNAIAADLVEPIIKLGPDAVNIALKYGDETVPLLLLYGKDAVDIIGAYGDDGISLLLKFGNEATDAIKLVKKFGTPAVKVLNAVDLDGATKLLENLDDDVLAYTLEKGEDAIYALSRWSELELKEFGPELALRAENDAIVIKAIDELVNSGPLDPKHLTREQDNLIKLIAECSTQYSDEGQIVLGKWVDYGHGFTKYARETGSVHYNPHPDMWNLFESLGKDKREDTAWLVNRQVIQNGIKKGLPFEYSFEGIQIKDENTELLAIQLIFSGETNEEIMTTLNLNYIPIRMKEIRELEEAGYDFAYDDVTKSFIFTMP
ncbi:MAG: Ig-like domain repeat protein [Anaerolineales bacterium]|nr:Ig-like domain repeat protein [Anaerolineales bacterium]